MWALDAFEARVSESPAGDDGAGKRGGNTDAGGADGLGLVHLVSGSADSVIVRWKDTSAMTAEKASAESSKQVEEEQRLANALATGAQSRQSHALHRSLLYCALAYIWPHRHHLIYHLRRRFRCFRGCALSPPSARLALRRLITPLRRGG